MISLKDEQLREFIRTQDAWLDEGASMAYQEQPMAQDWARIAKVSEELGEAIAAYILFTGQNPRKGTHTDAFNDVLTEFADVVLTGMLAIQHFTKDPAWTLQILEKRFEIVRRRTDESRLPQNG